MRTFPQPAFCLPYSLLSILFFLDHSSEPEWALAYNLLFGILGKTPQNL